MIIDPDDVISESSPVIGRRKEDIFTTDNNKLSIEKRSPQNLTRGVINDSQKQQHGKRVAHRRQTPLDLPRHNKLHNENGLRQELKQKYSNKALRSMKRQSPEAVWVDKFILILNVKVKISFYYIKKYLTFKIFNKILYTLQRFTSY